MAFQRLQGHFFPSQSKGLEDHHEFIVASAQELKGFTVFDRTILVDVDNFQILCRDFGRFGLSFVQHTITIGVGIFKHFSCEIGTGFNLTGFGRRNWFYRFNWEIALVPADDD